MKQIIKHSIKSILGTAYPHFMKEIDTRIKKYKGGFFSLNNLDKKLTKYLDYENGYYIELGANDGVTQSNTYHLELKKKWRGVLIDPSPHNYLSCKSFRGQNNKIFLNACVSEDYKEKYVDIVYANLMTISENLDLDLLKDQHIEQAKDFLPQDQDVFRFGALAATLTSLLDKAESPEIIDFLSLDVEGAELDVLKGINFSKYQFKYMLIESRDFDRVNSFLQTKGYDFIEKLSEHDYLFTRKLS